MASNANPQKQGPKPSAPVPASKAGAMPRPKTSKKR